MQWLIWLVVLLAAALGGEFIFAGKDVSSTGFQRRLSIFCCIQRTILKKH